jgi:CRP-like cAMP-binding protein
MSKNRILLALPQNDADWFLPKLVKVELKARDHLESPDQPIDRVFFVETGIAAVVSVSGKKRIGLGLIGCEGASGIGPILGDHRTPHATIMLTNGTALCLGTGELQQAMEQSPSLRRYLLRYVLAFHNQVAHTALSNALGTIEQRVARWVLMTHDRVAAKKVPLTHELIASMLGVRRAGVSTALEQFQKAKLLEIQRGFVRVRDLKGLRMSRAALMACPKRSTGECWGISMLKGPVRLNEADYSRPHLRLKTYL